MRLEATISEPLAEQLKQLAEELAVSKSQIIEESLAVFQKAVMELRRGRKLALVDAETRMTVCEFASPSLTQIEWTVHRQKIALTPQEVERMEEVLENAPAPSPSLQRASARRKKKLSP